MNTGSAVSPGDTVYIAPGSYYSEVLVPISGITSSGSPTAFRGDPLNAQGFKDGSGVRRAAGVCLITTRTSGENDATPAANIYCLALHTNKPAGLQVYNLIFDGQSSVGGTAGMSIPFDGSVNFLAEDCRFIGQNLGVDYVGGAPTAARGATWRRCILVGGTDAFSANTSTAAATADADLNITVEHCLLIGRVFLTAGSGAGNKSGGFHLIGCTSVGGFLASSAAIQAGGGHSTTTVSTYEGCTVLGATAMARGSSASQITDSGYNRGIAIGAANTNVTEAGTTKRNVAPHLVLPDLLKWGLVLDLNDMLGWSADAPSAVRFSGWTNTAADFRGRTVRPWGAGPSIGYTEAADLVQDTGSAITGGGTNALKVTGAGEAFDAWVELDGTFDDLTIVTKSSSYGGTSYPQFQCDANPSIGVSAQTATATDASEQTLTLTGFTGIVGPIRIRALSRSTSGSSTTLFDILKRVT